MVHVGGRDFHVLIRENTVWTSQETVQLRVWMQLLAHIEDTHDNVVTTCCLTTTENASKPKWLLKFLMANNYVILLLQLEVLHAISKQGWE